MIDHSGPIFAAKFGVISSQTSIICYSGSVIIFSYDDHEYQTYH